MGVVGYQNNFKNVNGNIVQNRTNLSFTNAGIHANATFHGNFMEGNKSDD
jgi:hypothetical protein